MTEDSDRKTNLCWSDPSHALRPRPVFPFQVTVGGATATLHSDGTVEGDGEAFRREMAKLECYPGFATSEMVVLWFVAAALPRVGK